MSFLRQLESFSSMFQRLPGMFLAGLVIFFSMMRRGRAVRVGGEFMELGGSLVRIVWHGIFFLLFKSILHPFTASNCSIMNIYI
jgi:hypothetical protein